MFEQLLLLLPSFSLSSRLPVPGTEQWAQMHTVLATAHLYVRIWEKKGLDEGSSHRHGKYYWTLFRVFKKSISELLDTITWQTTTHTHIHYEQFRVFLEPTWMFGEWEEAIAKPTKRKPTQARKNTCKLCTGSRDLNFETQDSYFWLGSKPPCCQLMRDNSLNLAHRLKAMAVALWTIF